MNTTSTVPVGLLVIIQTGDPCRVTGSAKGTFLYTGLISTSKTWPLCDAFRDLSSSGF